MTTTLTPMALPTPDRRCGTRAGYRAHWRRGENSCEPCREANATQAREWHDRNRTKASKPATDSPKCGTTAGAQRHSRLGEELCTPCLDARRQARREKSPVLPPRPPKPTADALAQAACRPWTGSHDSRRAWETDDEWTARLRTARAVCATCPAYTACKQLREHYQGRRNGVDGILAGQPINHVHKDQK